MSDTSIEARKDLPTADGLEDFEATDMAMPRLSIDHKEAVYVDNLTGEQHTKLRAVVLGLIKQRILWDTDVGDGDRPLCKSFNFKEGVPNEKTFPLEQSGFDALPTVGTLPCDACTLKDWGSHPQRDTPWCSEQHTLPLLMWVGGEEDGYFGAPAILTVQRSAIKSSKSYLTGFVRSRTPVYTVVTELSLDARKKGSVDYAVPRFAKVGDTDPEQYEEFAENYRSIRSFITTPPPDSDDAPDSEPAKAPESSPGVSEAATIAASSGSSGDDDLPF